MTDRPVLISGYREAAQSYAREHRLSNREWRHISDPEHLFGYREGVLVAVHGSRRDVEREAQLRGLTVEVARVA